MAKGGDRSGAEKEAFKAFAMKQRMQKYGESGQSGRQKEVAEYDSYQEAQKKPVDKKLVENAGQGFAVRMAEAKAKRNSLKGSAKAKRAKKGGK
jgi:hypothetical protein